MPQPQDPNLDPLLAFFEEHAKPPEPAEPAKDARADDLRVRVGQTERQVERALIGITTLKSDLATLVSAVEEIKKRTSRPPDKQVRVVPMPVRKVSRVRTLAAVLFAIVLGAAAWGLTSALTYETPEPPPIESKSSTIIELPPIVEAHSPAVRTIPAVAVRPPPRAVSFVGTLTIDAEPAGEVLLNRQNVGRTPLRLDNLRAGSHLIWIEREGYRRWTRSVAVAADRISRISASLDPLSR